MGKPKYWRTFLSPTPDQLFGVKLNFQVEGSLGTPTYWLQSKQHLRYWSTPIIWFGCVGLSSKQALIAARYMMSILLTTFWFRLASSPYIFVSRSF
jgi:hypothetical protein